MKLNRSLFLSATVLGVSLLLSGCVSNRPPDWLWAKVRVTQLSHFESHENNIRLVFSLSNNDPHVAKKTHLESSKLYIDGMEVEGTTKLINDGPRDRFWSELPPQTTIFFDRDITGFGQPGVHRIVWKGEVFESSPAVFRVVSPPHH